MGRRESSALIGGVIAAVIWTVICLLTGAPTGLVVIGAVLLLVGTAVVSWLIQTAIVRARRG